MVGKIPRCLLGGPSRSMCRGAWPLVPGELIAVVSHSGLLVHLLLCMTSVPCRLQSIMQRLTCSEAVCPRVHISTFD